VEKPARGRSRGLSDQVRARRALGLDARVGLEFGGELFQPGGFLGGGQTLDGQDVGQVRACAHDDGGREIGVVPALNQIALAVGILLLLPLLVAAETRWPMLAVSWLVIVATAWSGLDYLSKLRISGDSARA